MRASEGGGAAARARALPLWPQGLTRVSGALQRSALWKNRGLLTLRRRTLESAARLLVDWQWASARGGEFAFVQVAGAV